MVIKLDAWALKTVCEKCGSVKYERERRGLAQAYKGSLPQVFRL